MRRRLACLVWTAIAALPAVAAPERPTLVSLDYCADQYVLGLADRAQILALSTDATKPFSYLRGEADGIPQVRAMAEDVIALQPDLVVRSWGGDPRALALYARLGIGTVQIGYASDLAGTHDVTRAFAAAIGQGPRAEAMLAAAPRVVPGAAGTALYVTPGGVTAGSGTIIDSIMQAAGLTNSAAGAGWMSLPLEALVMQSPAVVLTAFFGFDTDRTDQWSPARHPALRQRLAGVSTVALNEARLACPAWFVAAEAASITAALGGPP